MPGCEPVRLVRGSGEAGNGSVVTPPECGPRPVRVPEDPRARAARGRCRFRVLAEQVASLPFLLSTPWTWRRARCWPSRPSFESLHRVRSRGVSLYRSFMPGTRSSQAPFRRRSRRRSLFFPSWPSPSLLRCSFWIPFRLVLYGSYDRNPGAGRFFRAALRFQVVAIPDGFAVSLDEL